MVFTTLERFFKPIVIFFGLTNSTVMFQTMMNEILYVKIKDGRLYLFLFLFYFSNLGLGISIILYICYILLSHNHMSYKNIEGFKMIISYILIICNIYSL